MRPLAIFAVAFFFATSSLVSAQWGGSFTLYGAGCKGTGHGGSCWSSNMDCLRTRSCTGTPCGKGEIIASVFKMKIAALATGASIRTQTVATNSATYTVELWKTDAAGKPTSQLGGTAKITVGATYNTYTGKFPAPIPLLPGSYAFVYQTTQQNSIMTPWCWPQDAGKSGIGLSPIYWRDDKTLPWKGPNQRAATIKVVCVGMSEVPLLTGIGIPTVNKTFGVDLDKAAVSVPCALFIGATKRSLSLTALGAPGCNLLTSADIALGLMSSATGSVKFQVKVPNNNFLANKSIYFQWGVIDKRANRLGIAMSAGGDAYIGP